MKMELMKIKLKDLCNEELQVNEMLQLKGGAESVVADGCYTGICSQKVNPEYCDGGAVCTSGIAGPTSSPEATTPEPEETTTTCTTWI